MRRVKGFYLVPVHLSSVDPGIRPPESPGPRLVLWHLLEQVDRINPSPGHLSFRTGAFAFPILIQVDATAAFPETPVCLSGSF